PDALRLTLEILAEHDPAGAWQSFTSRAADEAIRPAVVDGIRAALEAAESTGAEEAPVRRWLVASLDGNDESARDVALEVLGRKPDAALLPTLERVRAAQLSPATRRLVNTALAAFKATDGPLERSSRALTATQLYKLKGPIQSIQISFKGK